MKIIEVIGVSLLMLALMSAGAADVSLDIDCYNSDDEMTFALDAGNIDYAGLFELEPHEISFQNKGESTSPDNYYSLEQTFDGNNAHSSADTNSGSSAWAAQMATGNGDSIPQKFKVGAFHKVDDGFLTSEYGNNNIAANSNAIASEAFYSERVAITGNTLFAIGSGATYNQEAPNMDNNINWIEPVFANGVLTMSGKYAHGETGAAGSEVVSEQDANNADENNNANDEGPEKGSEAGGKGQMPTEIDNLPGFIQEVDVAGGGEWVHVNSAVIGKGDDATAKWAYGLKSSSDSETDENPYTIGLAASGASTNGFKLMAMDGKGSDIPEQRLPPGSFDINYQTDLDPITFQNLQYVTEKTNEFYEAYPSPEDKSTWYSWNHKAFISIDNIDIDVSNLEENKFDCFKMSMQFNVNPDRMPGEGKIIEKNIGKKITEEDSVGEDRVGEKNN